MICRGAHAPVMQSILHLQRDIRQSHWVFSVDRGAHAPVMQSILHLQRDIRWGQPLMR